MENTCLSFNYFTHIHTDAQSFISKTLLLSVMLSHPLQTISLVGWQISFPNQDSNPAVRGPAPTGMITGCEHKFSEQIHQLLISNPPSVARSVTYMYESKIPTIISKGRMFPKFQKQTEGFILKQNYNYQREITNKTPEKTSHWFKGKKKKKSIIISYQDITFSAAK